MVNITIMSDLTLCFVCCSVGHTMIIVKLVKCQHKNVNRTVVMNNVWALFSLCSDYSDPFLMILLSS